MSTYFVGQKVRRAGSGFKFKVKNRSQAQISSQETKQNVKPQNGQIGSKNDKKMLKQQTEKSQSKITKEDIKQFYAQLLSEQSQQRHQINPSGTNLKNTRRLVLDQIDFSRDFEKLKSAQTNLKEALEKLIEERLAGMVEEMAELNDTLDAASEEIKQEIVQGQHEQQMQSGGDLQIEARQESIPPETLVNSTNADFVSIQGILAPKVSQQKLSKMGNQQPSSALQLQSEPESQNMRLLSAEDRRVRMSAEGLLDIVTQKTVKDESKGKDMVKDKNDKALEKYKETQQKEGEDIIKGEVIFRKSQHKKEQQQTRNDQISPVLSQNRFSEENQNLQQSKQEFLSFGGLNKDSIKSKNQDSQEVIQAGEGLLSSESFKNIRNARIVKGNLVPGPKPVRQKSHRNKKFKSPVGADINEKSSQNQNSFKLSKKEEIGSRKLTLQKSVSLGRVNSINYDLEEIVETLDKQFKQKQRVDSKYKSSRTLKEGKIEEIIEENQVKIKKQRVKSANIYMNRPPPTGANSQNFQMVKSQSGMQHKSQKHNERYQGQQGRRRNNHKIDEGSATGFQSNTKDNNEAMNNLNTLVISSERTYEEIQERQLIKDEEIDRVPQLLASDSSMTAAQLLHAVNKEMQQEVEEKQRRSNQIKSQRRELKSLIESEIQRLRESYERRVWETQQAENIRPQSQFSLQKEGEEKTADHQLNLFSQTMKDHFKYGLSEMNQLIRPILSSRSIVTSNVQMQALEQKVIKELDGDNNRKSQAKKEDFIKASQLASNLMGAIKVNEPGSIDVVSQKAQQDLVVTQNSPPKLEEIADQIRQSQDVLRDSEQQSDHNQARKSIKSIDFKQAIQDSQNKYHQTPKRWKSPKKVLSAQQSAKRSQLGSPAPKIVPRLVEQVMTPLNDQHEQMYKLNSEREYRLPNLCDLNRKSLVDGLQGFPIQELRQDLEDEQDQSKLNANFSEMMLVDRNLKKDLTNEVASNLLKNMNELNVTPYDQTKFENRTLSAPFVQTIQSPTSHSSKGDQLIVYQRIRSANQVASSRPALKSQGGGFMRTQNSGYFKQKPQVQSKTNKNFSATRPTTAREISELQFKDSHPVLKQPEVIVKRERARTATTRIFRKTKSSKSGKPPKIIRQPAQRKPFVPQQAKPIPPNQIWAQQAPNMPKKVMLQLEPPVGSKIQQVAQQEKEIRSSIIQNQPKIETNQVNQSNKNQIVDHMSPTIFDQNLIDSNRKKTGRFRNNQQWRSSHTNGEVKTLTQVSVQPAVGFDELSSNLDGINLMVQSDPTKVNTPAKKHSHQKQQVDLLKKQDGQHNVVNRDVQCLKKQSELKDMNKDIQDVSQVEKSQLIFDISESKKSPGLLIMPSVPQTSKNLKNVTNTTILIGKQGSEIDNRQSSQAQDILDSQIQRITPPLVQIKRASVPIQNQEKATNSALNTDYEETVVFKKTTELKKQAKSLTDMLQTSKVQGQKNTHLQIGEHERKEQCGEFEIVSCSNKPEKGQAQNNKDIRNGVSATLGTLEHEVEKHLPAAILVDSSIKDCEMGKINQKQPKNINITPSNDNLIPPITQQVSSDKKDEEHSPIDLGRSTRERRRSVLKKQNQRTIQSANVNRSSESHKQGDKETIQQAKRDQHKDESIQKANDTVKQTHESFQQINVDKPQKENQNVGQMNLEIEEGKRGAIRPKSVPNQGKRVATQKKRQYLVGTIIEQQNTSGGSKIVINGNTCRNTTEKIEQGMLNSSSSMQQKRPNISHGKKASMSTAQILGMSFIPKERNQSAKNQADKNNVNRGTKTLKRLTFNQGVSKLIRNFDKSFILNNLPLVSQENLSSNQLDFTAQTFNLNARNDQRQSLRQRRLLSAQYSKRTKNQQNAYGREFGAENQSESEIISQLDNFQPPIQVHIQSKILGQDRAQRVTEDDLKTLCNFAEVNQPTHEILVSQKENTNLNNSDQNEFIMSGQIKIHDSQDGLNMDLKEQDTEQTMYNPVCQTQPNPQNLTKTQPFSKTVTNLGGSWMSKTTRSNVKEVSAINLQSKLPFKRNVLSKAHPQSATTRRPQTGKQIQQPQKGNSMAFLATEALRGSKNQLAVFKKKKDCEMVIGLPKQLNRDSTPIVLEKAQQNYMAKHIQRSQQNVWDLRIDGKDAKKVLSPAQERLELLKKQAELQTRNDALQLHSDSLPPSASAAAKLESIHQKRGSAGHVMNSEIESLIDWKDDRLSAKMTQKAPNAPPSFRQLNQGDQIGSRFKDQQNGPKNNQARRLKSASLNSGVSSSTSAIASIRNLQIRNATTNRHPSTNQNGAADETNKDLRFKQKGQIQAKEQMNMTTRTVDTFKTKQTRVSKSRRLNLTFDQVNLFVNDMTEQGHEIDKALEERLVKGQQIRPATGLTHGRPTESKLNTQNFFSRDIVVPNANRFEGGGSLVRRQSNLFPLAR